MGKGANEPVDHAILLSFSPLSSLQSPPLLSSPPLLFSSPLYFPHLPLLSCSLLSLDKGANEQVYNAILLSNEAMH